MKCGNQLREWGGGEGNSRMRKAFVRVFRSCSRIASAALRVVTATCEAIRYRSNVVSTPK